MKASHNATIMTAHNSEGCYGRCDARCHKAAHPDCDCICGGRYHGVGSSKKAQEMLTDDWLGSEWKDQILAAARDGGGKIILADAQAALPLA